MVVVVLMGTACTGEVDSYDVRQPLPTPSEAPSSRAESESPPSTGGSRTPSSASEIATPSQGGRSGALPHWAVTRVWRRSESGGRFGVRGDNYVALVSAPANADHRNVVEDLDGEIFLTTSAGGGEWLGQDAWTSDGYFAFMNINPSTRTAGLEVYGSDGHRQVIPGYRDPLGPEADLGYGRLAFTTGEPSRAMCVVVAELARQRVGFRECAEEGEIYGDIALDDRVLAYTSLKGWQTEDLRCKRPRFVLLSSGKHLRKLERLSRGALGGCQVWSGMPFSGGVAWDVADPDSETIQVGHAYAATNSGQVVDLGEVLTDSMRSCGDSLFWQKAEGSILIQQWRPGRSIRTILRSGRGSDITSLTCGDDHWLTTRVDGLSGENERLTLKSLRVPSETE